jgi:hypothetical protein
MPPFYVPVVPMEGTGSKVIPPCFLPDVHVDGTGNEVIPPGIPAG